MNWRRPKPHLSALAHEEEWLKPPVRIQRVKLRPWQRLVFWMLRFYSLVMLLVVGLAFYRGFH